MKPKGEEGGGICRVCMDEADRIASAPPPLVVHFCVFTYGGVNEETVDCILAEFGMAPGLGVQFLYDRVSGDALISRSRSVALSRFLLETEADVCFMLDRDIVCVAGEIVETCKIAHREKACVAGLYPKRTPGMGMTSRLTKDNPDFIVGEDRLWPAEYLATGFLAIPRCAPRAVVDTFCKTSVADSLRVQPFIYAPDPAREAWDFFRPVVAPSTMVKGKGEYLSEDWAWSRRASSAGIRQLVWSKPSLVHYGRQGFVPADGLPGRLLVSRT
ncbi:MAG: hypothetical protein ABIE42_09120 [Candidatus Eisenbacteria bacterium]